MSRYEVPQPILNSPYEEPAEHWLLEEGKAPQRQRTAQGDVLVPPADAWG